MLPNIISKRLSQKQLILLGTVLVSSALTATLVLFSQYYRKKKRKTALRRELLADFDVPKPRPALEAPIIDEALIREQLSRNYLFFGEDRMNVIRNAFVIVVGAGGVGSHAVHMLVRSGIQKIRVIDFDQVTLSSLNRHALATHADVGTSKVNCLQRQLKFIAPQAKIEAVNTLFNDASAEQLLSGDPDFVLDCIDNVPSKIQLIHFCYQRSIPLISSMGSGSKCDPTRIRISDISETIYDPLARSVRGSLRKLGITHGVNVVYSSEQPQVPLVPAQGENPEEFAPLPTFRSSILPVLGTLPALFGITMVTHVLTELTEWPNVSPLPRHHLSLTACTKMLKESQPSRLRVSDVFFLVEEIWHGRSVISGQVDSLVLVPWDPTQPASLQNCVLMTKEEAQLHNDNFPTYDDSIKERVASGISHITSLIDSHEL